MGSAFVLEEFVLGYWHVKAVCSADSLKAAKDYFEFRYGCDWEFNRVNEVPYVNS